MIATKRSLRIRRDPPGFAEKRILAFFVAQPPRRHGENRFIWPTGHRAILPALGFRSPDSCASVVGLLPYEFSSGKGPQWGEGCKPGSQRARLSGRGASGGARRRGDQGRTTGWPSTEDCSVGVVWVAL